MLRRFITIDHILSDLPHHISQHIDPPTPTTAQFYSAGEISVSISSPALAVN